MVDHQKGSKWVKVVHYIGKSVPFGTHPEMFFFVIELCVSLLCCLVVTGLHCGMSCSLPFSPTTLWCWPLTWCSVTSTSWLDVSVIHCVCVLSVRVCAPSAISPVPELKPTDSYCLFSMGGCLHPLIGYILRVGLFQSSSIAPLLKPSVEVRHQSI